MNKTNINEKNTVEAKKEAGNADMVRKGSGKAEATTVKDTKLSKKRIRKYVPIAARKTLYQRIAKYGPMAIATLVKNLDNPRASIRNQAARLILSKVIPDLKSMEIAGEVNQKVTVTVRPQYLQDYQDAEVAATEVIEQDNKTKELPVKTT